MTSVVVGARAPGEIAGSAELLAWPVPGELWADLEAARLIPGR